MTQTFGHDTRPRFPSSWPQLALISVQPPALPGLLFDVKPSEIEEGIPC